MEEIVSIIIPVYKGKTSAFTGKLNNITKTIPNKKFTIFILLKYHKFEFLSKSLQSKCLKDYQKNTSEYCRHVHIFCSTTQKLIFCLSIPLFKTYNQQVLNRDFLQIFFLDKVISTHNVILKSMN